MKSSLRLAISHAGCYLENLEYLRHLFNCVERINCISKEDRVSAPNVIKDGRELTVFDTRLSYGRPADKEVVFIIICLNRLKIIKLNRKTDEHNTLTCISITITLERFLLILR